MRIEFPDYPKNIALIEKCLQMRQYLEPLKRLLLSFPNDDEDEMNHLKMFLKCLWLPWQKGALETLSRYNLSDVQSIAIFVNSEKFLSFVLESNVHSPIANHTLQRTFGPSVKVLFGSDISSPTPDKYRHNHEEEPPQDVPHILQGEIARLDQKFSVSLDKLGHNKKNIKLICSLLDDHLPYVPPICVIIPEKYPFASPKCRLMEDDYLATPFLSVVLGGLAARITKLPKYYSLSHLLDIWELSVRRAFSPNTVAVYDLEAIFGV